MKILDSENAAKAAKEYAKTGDVKETKDVIVKDQY